VAEAWAAVGRFEIRDSLISILRVSHISYSNRSQSRALWGADREAAAKAGDDDDDARRRPGSDSEVRIGRRRIAAVSVHGRQGLYG
jgi:hypothetical protein